MNWPPKLSDFSRGVQRELMPATASDPAATMLADVERTLRAAAYDQTKDITTRIVLTNACADIAQRHNELMAHRYEQLRAYLQKRARP